VVTTFAGSSLQGSMDGTGSAARFFNPNGVAVDSTGELYVADTSNDTIRKLTPAGVVTTFAGTVGLAGSVDGTGVGIAALFTYPSGVGVDSAGNLYVSDSNNDTIRKITSAGVVTTFAGAVGLTGYSGGTDGSGSAARFDAPVGVAVDNAGNVFIADTYNNKIRKITPAAMVTSLAGGLYGGSGSTDGTGTGALFNGPMALRSTGRATSTSGMPITIRFAKSHPPGW